MKVPTGQSVLPIFYDVSPSEVRKQSGDYGKALAEHEERLNLGMMQRWREALVQVANLSGWDVQNKPQHREIEKIVERVINILGYNVSSLDDLVGMHTRAEQLESLLDADSDDNVRVIGVCGMGGIGKTTLARAVYDRHFHQYDACCFIDDVSKVYRDCGTIGVQRQLIYQSLNEENQEIWNVSKATHVIKTRLRHVKAFIVLDNVDQVEQLENLAVKPELLCAGSKIIVVSRNKHILEQFGVDKVYEVRKLNPDNALQLFCKNAFKGDGIKREYAELTNRALTYAQGHPLALKVLGSFLFGRDTSEWKSALDNLRDDPKKEIMDVLQISFDGLQPTEKEIFLDIACFFSHKEKTYVKRVLNCCGFHSDIGIRVLVDKSLITINKEGEVEMHDMLEQLGRKIVRERAPYDPRKWSRLWDFNDFQNVRFENTAMECPEAISLSNYFLELLELRAETLSKMSNLRLLILKNVDFLGSLDYLSNRLRYLEWPGYPFTCLPSSFVPNNIVELVMPYSSIKRLWEDTKPLHNLRNMDLRHSQNLIKTPHFRSSPNLEHLNLEGCTKLVEIHPSIGLLRKLVTLNLKNCTSLKSLPCSIFSLTSLEVLNLFGCSKSFNKKVLELPKQEEHLKRHEADASKTSSIILNKFSFHFFSCAKKTEMIGLASPSFPCLQDLNLSFCNLNGIPDAIGCLHGLIRLDLGGNNFVTLPCSIKDLPRLRSLNLQHCKHLKYLLEPPLSSNFTLPTERFHGEYVPASLYLVNCPKLVGAENWSNIALSWMKQVLQVRHRSNPPNIYKVEIFVPGTQVPRWFNNQSAGCSTRFWWPFPSQDSNWIGLAFCAPIYVPNSLMATLDVWFNKRTDNTVWGLDPVLGEAGSDNLFLFYCSRQALIDSHIEFYDGIEIKAICMDYHGDTFRVLVGYNYWFRWVFKHDLELEEESTTSDK